VKYVGQGRLKSVVKDERTYKEHETTVTERMGVALESWFA
jgi:hypothetical protein